MVDAVVEYEVMSGMVGTAMSVMSQVKMEHNSLIRRMQGAEANIHASMSKGTVAGVHGNMVASSRRRSCIGKGAPIMLLDFAGLEMSG